MRKLSSRKRAAPELRRSVPFIGFVVILVVVSCVSTRSRAQTEPARSATPTVESSANDITKGDYLLNKYKLDIDKWPNTTFSFSLENKKQESFRQLNISDIEVTTDEPGLVLKPTNLRITASDPVGVLILLDGSGSMSSGTSGFHKLSAAKEAIKAFVNNLDDDDLVALYAFDSSLYRLSGPVNKSVYLNDLIEGIAPRGVEFSKHTDLYQAVKEGIAKAKESKFRNLVIISDGMQDTVQSEEIRLTDESLFTAFKGEQEQEVSELAIKNGVTIYPIAIGDKDSLPAVPTNLNYVDADSLCNMMSRQIGEKCPYVSLPELKELVPDGTSASLQSILGEQLKKIFEKINNSVRYGYAVDVPFPKFVPDDRKLLMKISVKLGANIFSVDYPLTWTKGLEDAPNIGASSLSRRVLIETPKLIIMPVQLAGVYLSIFSILGVLAFVPLLLQRVHQMSHDRERNRALKRSIMVLKEGSNLIGLHCPNHKNFPKPFKPGDGIILCPVCGEAHHIGCWKYNKSRCMKWLCPGELQIPDEIWAKHGAAV